MYAYGIWSCRLLVPVGIIVRDETIGHILPSFYILGENSIKTDFSSELNTLENTELSTDIYLVTSNILIVSR
jgi:hypothetical protein